MMHKKSQIHLKFRPKLERISRNIVILSKVFGSSMVETYHTKSDCPMFLGCMDLYVGLILVAHSWKKTWKPYLEIFCITETENITEKS